MTVITLTTAGFQEACTLSLTGRVFITGITGSGITTYSITLLIYSFEGKLSEYWHKGVDSGNNAAEEEL